MNNNILNEKLIAKLYQAADLYKQNLVNKNIAFIYEDKHTHQLLFIEAQCAEGNLLHLTGLQYCGTPSRFYEACINRRLSLNDLIVDEKNQKFIALKLDVLIGAMSINEIARSVGDFDFHREKVTVEKMVGNVSLCVGFSKISKTGEEMKYYYPQTLLKDRINYNVKVPNKIIAIMSKPSKQELYDEITYMAKDTSFARLFDNEEIGEMIDYENVHSKNSYCQTKIDDFFADMAKIAQFNQELMLSMKLKDEMVVNTIAENDETNENNIDYEFEDYEK